MFQLEPYGANLNSWIRRSQKADLPIVITCSINLFEYPYSLSYQAKTLTKSPSTTWVRGRSTIADSLLPIMSVETSGSSETAKIWGIFLAASVKTLLTSSTEALFPKRNVKSEIDPIDTGTRNAIPSNFPFNSGIASVVEIAAPEVVGIILM